MEACLYRGEQSKKIPTKNQSMLTYKLQNKRNQNLKEEWLDQLSRRSRRGNDN